VEDDQGNRVPEFDFLQFNEYLATSGFGINAKIILSDSSYFNNKTLLIENSGSDYIQKDELVSVKFDFENNGSAGSGSASYIGLHYEIQTALYQLTTERGGNAKRWVLKTALNPTNDFWKFFQGNGRYGIGLGRATLIDDLPPFPEDSDIKIKVFRDVTYNSNYSQDYRLVINSIKTIPSSDANMKGEFHTGERKSRLSSVTKADKVVYNGDSESDIYNGTLYKKNSDPTTTWNRIGKTETKPLLQLLVEDTLRLRPRPMLLFEGDTYGYYPYLSLFTIDNVTGEFQVGKYSFITTTNVNKNNFRELEIEDMDDYNYRLELDYGNATKVGISVT